MPTSDLLINESQFLDDIPDYARLSLAEGDPGPRYWPLHMIVGLFSCGVADGLETCVLFDVPDCTVGF